MWSGHHCLPPSYLIWFVSVFMLSQQVYKSFNIKVKGGGQECPRHTPVLACNGAFNCDMVSW